MLADQTLKVCLQSLYALLGINQVLRRFIPLVVERAWFLKCRNLDGTGLQWKDVHCVVPSHVVRKCCYLALNSVLQFISCYFRTDRKLWSPGQNVQRISGNRDVTENGYAQWRTQKRGLGVLPPEKFWIFRLKNARFLSCGDTLPNVFSRLMLPVVVAQSYYSFTPAVCAFLQARPLLGRKLVIGWKTWEIRKALLDVVELWRINFPPYSLCLSQKLPTLTVS